MNASIGAATRGSGHLSLTASRFASAPRLANSLRSTRIDTTSARKFRHHGVVQLPDSVRRRIEERAEEIGFAALKHAAEALSAGYRGLEAAYLPANERIAAYLVTRMPSTYAAARRVLQEINFEIGSVLDLGSGTGASALAAHERFPSATITMFDRDAAMLDAAREWLPDAAARVENFARLAVLPEADLVIASYSLGETGADWTRLWRAARQALVIIEPGATVGFALIRKIRDDLLAKGARMIAPCPAESPCPIADPDWCHFAARVERSSLHRRVKGGDLGYEDEKFSYVILGRDPVGQAHARIIRRLRHEPGLITLQLCTPAGLEKTEVRKRNREQFRQARHADWGDRWPSPGG